jgi:multidrug resistance efflux pump
VSNCIIKTVHVLTVALLFCLYGCGEEANTGVDKKTDAPTEKWVRVSPVEASAAQGHMEYVGVLLANRKVKVSSELGGLIERLHFEKGDQVKEGMLLAEIGATSARLQVKEAAASAAAARSGLDKLEKGSRPQEIQIARSAVSAAEAAMFEAEKNHDRIKRLYEIRAISNSSLDAAERELTTARANMESAKQQVILALEGPRIEDIKASRAALAQAEAARGLAQDRLNKSMIKAPCDGIIAFREVEQGEVILPGTPITEIVELGQMKIKVSLSEKDLHTLKHQKRFPFTVDAIPREEFSCRVFFLSPTGNTSTRAFPLELMVDNPDPRMADGMTVRVRFPIAGGRKAIKVPSAWLSEEDGEIGVYVFKGGKALFQPITLGAYYDNRVEILKGLGDKDLIITNPAGLKSGEVVEVRQ